MDLSEFKAIPFKDVKGKEYIELRIGKHRKKGFKKDSLYYKPLVFSIFDEVIWYRYREYSPTSTNAITSRDWNRIIEGFETFLININNSNSTQELRKALRFRSNDIFPEYVEIDNFKQQMVLLFNELHSWITESTKEEEYITICV